MKRTKTRIVPKAKIYLAFKKTSIYMVIWYIWAIIYLIHVLYKCVTTIILCLTGKSIYSAKKILRNLNTHIFAWMMSLKFKLKDEVIKDCLCRWFQFLKMNDSCLNVWFDLTNKKWGLSIDIPLKCVGFRWLSSYVDNIAHSLNHFMINFAYIRIKNFCLIYFIFYKPKQFVIKVLAGNTISNRIPKFILFKSDIHNKEINIGYKNEAKNHSALKWTCFYRCFTFFHYKIMVAIIDLFSTYCICFDLWSIQYM